MVAKWIFSFLPNLLSWLEDNAFYHLGYSTASSTASSTCANCFLSISYLAGRRTVAATNQGNNSSNHTSNIIPQTMFSWTLFMAVMYLWIYEICCIRLQVFSRRLGSNEQTVHLLICFPVLYYSSYFIFKSKSNLIWLYSFCPSPEVIAVLLLLEFSYLH